jgi:protein disulfide-isomerase A6
MNCKSVRVTWNELAKELDGAILVAEINGEVEKDVAHSEGIRGYPTIALYVSGRKVVHSGKRDKEAILKFVNKEILT